MPIGSIAVHALAIINDPLSHGQLGDNLLSLDEVIQLHNLQLMRSQLSPAELNQIIGPGDIAWAQIDASSTPVITVERDLDVIQDFPHGLRLGGVNGRPVIDFSQVPHGFVSVSNYCSWESLVLRGGPFGIDLTQSQASGGTTLQDCEFENQTSFGLRVTNWTPGGNNRVLLRSCQFRNEPAAIVFDESHVDNSTVLYLEDVSASNIGAVAFDIVLGQGGSGLYVLKKLRITAGTGVRFSRPNSATRTVTLQATHWEIVGAQAFEFETTASAPCGLTLQMLDLRSNVPGGRAINLYPLGGNVSGTIDELQTDGDAVVLAGGVGSLTIDNARLRNGSCTLGHFLGSAMQMLDSRLDGVSLHSSGTAPITLFDCCCVGGSAQGTVPAPLQCANCYFSSIPGPEVVNMTPVPAEQLGSFTVSPTLVSLGAPLTLQAALPPGLFGIWVVGLTADPPTILGAPLHLYVDLTATSTAPGIYRQMQSLTFAMPIDPTLSGMDLVCQMAVFADPTLQAPPLSLPPGHRFVLQ